MAAPAVARPASARSIPAAVLVALVLTGAGADAAPAVDLPRRLDAQAAIEEVYASHRLWPQDNAAARPGPGELLPGSALRERVRRYLRESERLARRGCPLTAGDLQAEMGRMAASTRSPAVLRELFAALGNDPALVAETLARQTLAGRLRWSADPCEALARIRRSADDTHAAAPAATTGKEEGPALTRRLARRPAPVAISGAAAGDRSGEGADAFRLPSVAEDACADDTWVEVGPGTDVPGGRYHHTMVWTGAEAIVWGGVTATAIDPVTNTGGRYDPATDAWTPTATDGPVPEPRTRHTAVWTGTEMIIWGGVTPTQEALATGARYNPATDTWIAMSNTPSTPAPRKQHTAVWTGAEMIVWGGDDLFTSVFNTGGRYDPLTDSWTPTSVGAGVPSVRSAHTAVWTGTEMIVWGGYDGTYLDTGARYDPAGDTWTATSTGTGVPPGRYDHTVVWTGTEMIVWGGSHAYQATTDTGGRYDPAADTWLPTSTAAGTPGPRRDAAAVWNGEEMIIWGGPADEWGTQIDTGGRYDPAADAWTPTASGGGVPAARAWPEAVWTGGDMLVWGGRGAWTGWEWDHPVTTAHYCAVPDCPVYTWYSDDDGDGHGIPSDAVLACSLPPGHGALGDDCLDADPSVWTPPAVVSGVQVLPGGGTTWWILWSSQSGGAGPGTSYDVIGGSLHDLRSAGGFIGAACLGEGLADGSWEIPGPDPAPGTGAYYLVRAQNACGAGGYGDSTQSPDPRDALDASGPCP